jgi:hypothetical protein
MSLKLGRWKHCQRLTFVSSYSAKHACISYLLLQNESLPKISGLKQLGSLYYLPWVCRLTGVDEVGFLLTVSWLDDEMFAGAGGFQRFPHSRD